MLKRNPLGAFGWDLDYHKTLGNARSSRFFVNWCRISSINSNCIYIIERYGNPTIVTVDTRTQIHETIHHNLSVVYTRHQIKACYISGLMSSYFIISPTTKTKDARTSRNKILPSSHLPKKLVGWFYPPTNIILIYFNIVNIMKYYHVFHPSSNKSNSFFPAENQRQKKTKPKRHFSTARMLHPKSKGSWLTAETFELTWGVAVSRNILYKMGP